MITKLLAGVACLLLAPIGLVHEAKHAVEASDASGVHSLIQGSAILDRLAGAWEGEGELFGQPATFSMIWDGQLGGRFLGLSYEIRGAVQMSAIAHYRTSGDTLRGVWVDSRGEILQLAATTTDSTLDTVWKSPTETGRTLYLHVGADSLWVRDFVQGESGWRPFGSARYGRR